MRYILLLFLISCNEKAIEVVEKKVKKVEKEAEKTAEDYYNEAIYYLSKYKESIKAIHLLKKACELDNADACFRLANMDVKKRVWYAEKAYRLSGRWKEFLDRLKEDVKFENWVDFE